MKLVKQTYQQDMHTCGDQDGTASLAIEVFDVPGNDGYDQYVVVDVHQWAFDNAAEVDEFSAAIKAMLKSP
jgi:hypothetical protein